MARPQFTPSSPGEIGTPAPENNPSQPAPVRSEEGAQNQVSTALPAISDEALTPALEKALANLERKRQAADDKRAAQINNRVAEVLKAIQGLNLPQEQVQKIQDQAKALAETDMSPNSQTAQAGQAQPVSEKGNDGQAPDPVTAASWEIMDDEGLEIDETDPEAKMIKYTDKATARRTTLEALAAKRKRQAAGALPLGGGQPAGRPAHFGRPPRETLDNYFDSVIPKG